MMRAVCGRAKLSASPDDLREAFQLDHQPELRARYNIAPTQPIAIVRVPHRLELLRWGLLLGNAGSTGSAGSAIRRPAGGGINVRVESAARAPAYRDAFRSRRCLVVVDGFYEWKRAGGKKQPFLVQRSNGRPFALAGLWERALSADGEIVESCAVLTCAAAGSLAELHDRMPVIVPASAYARWLEPSSLRNIDDVLGWGRGAEGDLVAFAVNGRVNSAANDDAGCIEPVADPRQVDQRQ